MPLGGGGGTLPPPLLMVPLSAGIMQRMVPPQPSADHHVLSARRGETGKGGDSGSKFFDSAVFFRPIQFSTVLLEGLLVWQVVPG